MLVLPSTVSSWCLPHAPHPAGLAQQQPVGSAVGAARQRLDDQAVQVLSQPGMPELLGIGVQRVLRAVVLGTRFAKAHLSCGIVARQGPGVLEGLGLADQLHAAAGLAQAGVVDLASGLQAGEQRPFLSRRDPQRHLADKGGRALGRIISGLAPDRHRFLALERIEQKF